MRSSGESGCRLYVPGRSRMVTSCLRAVHSGLPPFHGDTGIVADLVMQAGQRVEAGRFCRYWDCPGGRPLTGLRLGCVRPLTYPSREDEDPLRFRAAEHEPVPLHVDLDRIAKRGPADESKVCPAGHTHLEQPLSGPDGETPEGCNRAMVAGGELLQCNLFASSVFLSVDARLRAFRAGSEYLQARTVRCEVFGGADLFL